MKTIIFALFCINSIQSCHVQGPVCGSNNVTYQNECACTQAGHMMQYQGPCRGSGHHHHHQGWVAQRDSSLIGKPQRRLDLSDGRMAWGWEKQMSNYHGLDPQFYVHWKFDEDLPPQYDFSEFGDGLGGNAVNYNSDYWNWGNWAWMTDVQNNKQNNVSIGCCNTCAENKC